MQNNPQEPTLYFDTRTEDEDCPLKIEEETNVRYYNLEQIFNSFFSSNSLTVAKEKSKEERDTKRINDSAFTYGEVVKKIFFNKEIIFLYEN